MATFRELHALVTCKTFRLFFRLSRIIIGGVKKKILVIMRFVSMRVNMQLNLIDQSAKILRSLKVRCSSISCWLPTRAPSLYIPQKKAYLLH